MKCPTCPIRLNCVSTRNTTDGVTRRYTCSSCGGRFSGIERLVDSVGPGHKLRDSLDIEHQRRLNEFHRIVASASQQLNDIK